MTACQPGNSGPTESPESPSASRVARLSHLLIRARAIADLRQLSRKRLPRSVFEFFDGGAEDESTLRGNTEAFERLRLIPKVLVDVSAVDTSASIAGIPSRLPLAIAPMGAMGFGWREADVAIARAAAACGVPFTLSTTGTASIERVAREAGGQLWFQIFPLKDRELMFRLIERARIAGYVALLVTVDTPVGGKRERDFRNDIAMPFVFTPRNVFDFAKRPAWALSMLFHGVPTMENLSELSPDLPQGTGVASSIGRIFDSSFDWSLLAGIRERWPHKLIVKGVMRPEDAERAADIGCDAVVVSNHGGRQLDGAMASMDALPEVVSAVGNRISILVDGGIRRGQDIVKALSLGAEGVLVGRAVLYGACVAGEAGALHALEILREETTRTMQLCGADSVADLDRSFIRRTA